MHAPSNGIRSPSGISLSVSPHSLKPAADFVSPRMPGTSRVIDTLQSQVDALKRELQAERRAREAGERRIMALQARAEAAEAAGEGLGFQNNNLERLLSRKERRLGEVESVLRDERRARTEGIKEVQSLQQRLQQCEEEARAEREHRLRCDAAYTSLQQSIQAEQRRGVDELKADVKRLRGDRERDLTTIRNLQGNLEKEQRENALLRNLMSATTRQRHEQAAMVQNLVELVHARMDEAQAHDDEIAKTLGDVRYLRTIISMGEK